MTSDPDIALRAENKTASLALEALSEALVAGGLTTLRSTVDKDDVILNKRPKSTSFKPTDKISKFQVHPMDPNKKSSHWSTAGSNDRCHPKSVPARELGHLCQASFGYARNPMQTSRT